MDEYNINNIEKINSINFININNEQISSGTSDPIYNKFQYLKSINNINSGTTKKNKSFYKKGNNIGKNIMLPDKYIEETMKSLNLLPKYTNEDISADYNMNRSNISEMKMNNRRYEGIQRRNNNPILNNKNITNQKNKQNTINPLESIKYNDNNIKYKMKTLNSKDGLTTNNQVYKNNNKSKYNTHKTLFNYNNINNNNNNGNLNYFTDFSVDDATTSQNSKLNSYVKKIEEYKKRDQQLIGKVNLLTHNLQLKTKENQNLLQKNQSLQNELLIIKANNEQSDKNMNINNNEELKKVLMQKNKMIKDVYQKNQQLKKDLETIKSKNTYYGQILTKKNLEVVDYQKEIVEKDKKIEELNFALNQEKTNEDFKNENLNLMNEELKKENSEKEKQIVSLSKKINDLEIDLKGIKYNEKEYFLKNIKNKELIEQKDKEIQELKEQINTSNKNLELINKENQKKEYEILLKRIEELSNQNNKLTKHINALNLKNISQNPNISPDNYTIIANKYHNKLLWYLLFKKSSPPEVILDEKDYNNYIWVKESEIKKEDLYKYNEFEDEKNKINELKEFNMALQKKLEIKEEKINKLDYQNQKLSNQLHNKTANIKGINLLNKQSKDNSNFANSFNTEAAENERKYKNILEKLNDSNKRNIHLHNQVLILKEKLDEKDKLEKKFPHDLKDIDPNLHDSGFLDDDSFEDKERDINDLLNKEPEPKSNIIENKENNILTSNNSNNEEDLNKAIKSFNSKDDPFKESERKVDEFLAKGAGEADDFDEVKMINKQMNFLKEEIKDYRERMKKLVSEIKELFSKIKCNDKNRKNIVQICQILAFSPSIIDQIVNNKFKLKDKNNKK